jgi:hypothetical protein
MPADTAETGDYVPGVCNINRAEIAKRRTAGYIGTVIFLVVLAAAIYFSLPSIVKLLLFLPGYLGSIGFLQAREKFCVGFAAASKQNATEGSQEVHDIKDESSHKKDLSRAALMKRQASIIALVFTVIALALPPYKF